MSIQPALRPLRRVLQSRLQPATTRPVQNVFLQTAIQRRTNASVSEPPSIEAKQASKAVQTAAASSSSTAAAEPDPETTRLPRSVQALYLQPLRREAEYGVPSCDLQLRSYSLRNLEFFCDFALRAAYYLGLPAFGPVPLPKITERWTVPRSHFIFKKSQENFERITRRRLIQIRDGNPETVQVWLAFLQKHAYYGIGMKANVWEFSSLDVGKNMDAGMEEVSKLLEGKWDHLWEKKSQGTVQQMEELLAKERVRLTGGR